MRLKLEWVAIGALLLVLLVQGAWMSMRLERQQEQLSRSVEAVSKDTAAAVREVGRAVELVGRFGERSTVIRLSPTEVRVSTDRPNGRPAEGPRQPPSLGTTRPGPGTSPGPGGATGQPPDSAPRAIVLPGKREDARARASVTIRVEFDPGSLNCPGNPEGPDTIELYIFPDSLGTTAPCVRRLTANFRTAAEPLRQAKQVSRVFAMAGFPAGLGAGYTVTTFKVPLLGRFNVDAIGFQSIGVSSQTFFGAGVSKDISYSMLAGVGAAQSLQGGTMVLGYFGTRW